MKTRNLHRIITGTAAMSFMFASIYPFGSIARADNTTRLAAGSVIPVRLNDPLSSKDAQKGDTFTTTVRNDSSDLYYNLPAGTKIEGVVRNVRAQQDKDPGVLDLNFTRIRMPDGKSYAINGSLIGLDNKSVEKRSDGRLIAKPAHRNDRLTYAGYGAAAGLIVGLVTKHALEDTLIGGGLGYLFSSLQKGQSSVRDVTLKSGTEMGVRLDSSVQASDYNNDPENRNSKLDNNNNGNGDNGKIKFDKAVNRNSSNSGKQNTSSLDIPEIGVLVDSDNVAFNSNAMPYLSKGVVMVPAAPVLRATKVPYTFSNSRLSATGTEKPVRVSVGSSIAILNGRERVRMEAPVQLMNGAVYVPLKFLALATGDKVTWDYASSTVVITSGK